MARFLVLTVIVLMLLVASPALAADEGSGKIEGVLVNSTVGSTVSVANLNVVAQIYQGTKVIGEKNTISDQNGKFNFVGLNTDPTFIYVVKVIFKEVDYYSDAVKFAAGETTKSTMVKVYDTTDSDQAVSIEMTHVIISTIDDVINVKENYLFLNKSDLTYIGLPAAGKVQQRETLRFAVPPEVKSVVGSVGLEQSSIIVQNGGFSVGSAVTPDGIFISYTYKILLTSDQKALSWKINYDMGRFDLLLENQNIKVTGNSLAPEAPLTISGKTYNHYSSLDLKKGSNLTVQLADLMPRQSQSTFSWVWLLIIPMAAGVVFIIIFKRKQSKKKILGEETSDNQNKKQLTAETASLEETSDNQNKKQLTAETAALEDTLGNQNKEHLTAEIAALEYTLGNQSKEQLMAEIAALDDSYEEGDISQEEYVKLRQEKKQKLINIINKSNLEK